MTCLACCPVAHYAAVGTTTGKVLFIDLNQEQRPRMVHEVLLYHSAVDHLVQVSSIFVMLSRAFQLKTAHKIILYYIILLYIHN